MCSHRRAFRAPLAVALVLSLLLAACADGDDDSTATVIEAPPADVTTDDVATDDPTPDDATTEGPAAGDALGVEVFGDTGDKPQISLPGGEPPNELQVVDLVEGDGEEVAEGATVTTHYVGVSWLNDGEEFDSSWDRGAPTTFPLDQVIPGWTEGIPGMRVGGRRLLIIPPELAYGAAPPPGAAIEAHDTLVFVIDIPEPPEPIEPGTDTFGVEVSGELDEKPQVTLPGGEPPADLVVVDLVVGDGDVVPAEATVTTHYVGVSWLNDGEEFDSSWDRGEPSTFPLSGVIPGWTEGIPGMRVGGRRLLVIPPDQAYGPPGRPPAIAANDTLVFVIDVTAVQ